jgi:hypothetical protein
VQFLEAGDAAEAQYNLDHQVIGGREITVVFAEENRKKPQEMRSKERIRYSFSFVTKMLLHNFTVSISICRMNILPNLDNAVKTSPT